MTFFDFGRNCHLALVTVVEDDDFDARAGYWLSGRIFGRIIHIFFPWRGQR